MTQHTDSTPNNDWIITITCDDQPGLVHAITGGIVDAHGNIEESQQFHSTDTGRFFMRLRISTPASERQLRAALTPVVEQYHLDLTLRESDRPTKTLVLVSKAAHCLQDLLFRQNSGQTNIEIPRVFGNHPDLADLAGFYGVPFTSLPIKSAEDKHAFEQRIMKYVEENDIELVVLARYMQILSPELCDFLSGRAINIHHSFLPGFKGANPYLQAHQRGVKLIGATAHFVTADLDEGPIIEQNVVRVDHSKSPAQLRAIGQDVESRTLRQAVTWFAERRILRDGQRTIIFQ
ncbi:MULTISPECIES: formyltetrahydrofolate deformylase [unclassified Pseudoclavibacter]|uniref:formyltetrahydrofolate deformylase n=1 Tax=unclassified Pseudoclavibacter TaxID=2615177 RepID=UPI0013012CE6|nr:MULTISPECIES: formyltetrahydrofolate deformylase [unclassified Pseudoclavibacter]KAB1647523.1 formyltetrahydrofolate deformylase [Pseudoclavibacter sp. CFCC 14310]KAB1663156.1 formyltetrahydrofolate deformylase [Pseudoclavibacter sp. CFCC 13611]